jgi:hypothetical protein
MFIFSIHISTIFRNSINNNKYMKIKNLLKISSSALLTLLFTPISSNAQISDSSIFRNGDLEITFSTEFVNIWDDRGSGSNRNGGFFRPKTTNNFYSLGDMAIGGYDPAGHAVAVVRDRSNNQDILVAPTDYTFYYNDAGSGSNRDGSMWHPTCPTGYVAMGSMAGVNSKPSLNDMRCIKESYVKEATLSNIIWDDRGSGGDRSMSAWQIESPGVNAGEGLMHISPNTFFVSSNYGKPANKAYALIIPMEEEIPVDADVPSYPELTSINPPSPYAANGSVSISYLPWFSVKDNLTMIEQITKSPTYKLERKTQYKLVHFLYNGTAQDNKQTYKTKVGTNQEKSTSFTKEVGVQVAASWKSPVGWSAAITLSSKFSHTTGGSTAWSSEEEKSAEVTVKPKTASAVYIVESTYSLYRMDGTQIGIDLGHVPTANFYTVDYDPTSSVGETELNNMFKVYPTASTGEFKVDLMDAYVPNQQNIVVSDLKGNVVLTQNITSKITVLDLTGNAAGMYIMNVLDGNKISTKKIILE